MADRTDQRRAFNSDATRTAIVAGDAAAPGEPDGPSRRVRSVVRAARWRLRGCLRGRFRAGLRGFLRTAGLVAAGFFRAPQPAVAGLGCSKLASKRYGATRRSHRRQQAKCPCRGNNSSTRAAKRWRESGARVRSQTVISASLPSSLYRQLCGASQRIIVASNSPGAHAYCTQRISPTIPFIFFEASAWITTVCAISGDCAALSCSRARRWPY